MQFKRSLIITAVAACLAIGAVHAQTPAAKGTLDGKTFHGTLTQIGGKPDSDDFVFRNGQFVSSICQGFGFTPTAYTSTQDGKLIHFTAEAHSGKATMQWSGTVDGTKIHATAKRSSPGESATAFAGEGKIEH